MRRCVDRIRACIQLTVVLFCLGYCQADDLNATETAWGNPEEFLESEPLDGLNIYENDILIPKNRLHRREVNTIRRWPTRIIPYEIDPRAGFEKNETDMLLSAFKEFKDKTCVQFVPRTNEADYVFITTDPRRGCLSYIGWQGGRQEVYLLRPNCFYLKGTVIHELMHTIGFYHEHSRPDRDDHVQILWNNIRPDKTSNFQIEQSGNLLGVPYDYLSLMHYSALTFSKDPDSKDYSMVPRDPSFPPDKLGQRRSFSSIDLQQILKFYDCPKRDIPSGSPATEIFNTAASHNFDPEDPGGVFQQAFRQARLDSDTQFVRQGAVPVLQSAPQFRLIPQTRSSGPAAFFRPSIPLQVPNNAVCSATFFPDAILSFLGFFYIFKDGLYWKFAYSNGSFKPEMESAKSYNDNFHATLPDKLDSVISYLTFIYFIKGNKVWVAKSDTEIRGPIDLTQLFPSLPDIPWENVYVRTGLIHFVWRNMLWLYDVKTDKVFGPTKGIEPETLLSGRVAELPDGSVLLLPKPSFDGQNTQVYVLTHLGDKVLPGFPKKLSDVFCT